MYRITANKEIGRAQSLSQLKGGGLLLDALVFYLIARFDELYLALVAANNAMNDIVWLLVTDWPLRMRSWEREL